MKYIYMIYTDTPSVNLFGKVGRGTNRRYKSYVTSYGRGYKVYILYTDNYINAERLLLTWCREKGYIGDRTETISIPIDVDQSLKEHIDRYNGIIHSIYTYMCSLGTVYNINYNDPLPIPYVRYKKEVVVTRSHSIPNKVYRDISDIRWISRLHINNASGWIKATQDLFSLGRYPIQRVIGNKDTSFSLIFYKSDKYKILQHIMNAGMNISSDVWGSIRVFITLHLLMSCPRYIVEGNRYIYNIDCTNWIYYTMPIDNYNVCDIIPIYEYVDDTYISTSANTDPMYHIICMIQGLRNSSIPIDRIESIMDKTIYNRYRSLYDLFLLGGVDLLHVPNSCTLSYRADIDIDPILDRIGYTWNVKLIGHRKWSYIEEFLRSKIGCKDVRRIDSKSNNIRKHKYTFNWSHNDTVCTDYIALRRSIDGYDVTAYDCNDSNILMVPNYYKGVRSIATIGSNDTLSSYGYI